MSIKMSTPFKVEQTTQVDVALTTPLKKGEEVYFMLEDVYAPNNATGTPGMVNPDVVFKKMDYKNQMITFQFTPYRGSCGELNTNYPVRMYAFKDAGGVSDIVPPNSYIDPFYYDFAEKDERGTVLGSSPTPPNPPMPKNIVKAYDCYLERSYNVIPEEMKIGASRKCIDTLSQRFPNFTLRLNDADNPNDVNDPNNVRISIPYGEMPLVANYNAHDGGIDYMFTAYDMRYQVECIDIKYLIETVEQPKVLVQMNKDGSYLYWYWQDNGIHGILDELDILAGSPLYPNDPDPLLNTPKYLTGYDRLNWIDMDCSETSQNSCPLCAVSDFGKMNKITKGDRYAYGNTEYFEVINYGIPTKVTSYQQKSGGDQGGEINIAVSPVDGTDEPLEIRVYTMNALYDYNSSMTPPPFFLKDSSNGIDYCGTARFKVLPPDPYLNFAEYKIIDHGLQNSRINYTSGTGALSDLPTPTPQIESPYDPIIKDVGKDFRAYPGGQTHTGRVDGAVYTGSYLRVDGEHNGWNAYPAIWWWYWTGIDVDYNNFTDFNRLGTEFYPMTDYSMYFILKDAEGNHLTFDNKNIDLKIRKLTVDGPFITPYVFNKDNNSVKSTWSYNGVRNVPVKYDRSGIISIDSSNAIDYVFTGDDWTKSGNDSYIYTNINEYLEYSNELNYRGLTDVFYIPEIIPVGSGVVTLTVTLWDGTIKIFQDCCAEPPTDGVDVHGINIDSSVETITVDTDTKIELNVSENEVMQTVEPANDAVVVAWQDRGILNLDTGLYSGAGDGWLTNAPASSNATDVMYQFDPSLDLNEDGKISFADYETEIVGSYNLATNTWTSGIIDARTFQRDNGKYVFDLSANNSAQLTQIGLDFGSFDLNGIVNIELDHIISEFEALPLYINAYKYADDNNDRAFTPLFNLGNNIPQYSHEVYLAGMKIIDIVPIRDLSVSISPTVLTAGCIPELVDPASPLSVIVTNEDGEPVDLTIGVPDVNGNDYVEKDAIWQNLFKDVHPDPLPEYYWLRTDLHNKDMTLANNTRLYDPNFYPIKPDFTLASDGKYAFNGFCANDKGEFEIYVYTPDRKHVGVGKVRVELPDVSYSIVNTEDPSGSEYTVPGEPDFVLTAADNRIYQITVTCKDARGLMIKGVSKGVSTCGGGTKNTARFTVYSNRPESWNFSERDRFLFADHFMQDLYPYNLNVGFDFNDNKKIDWRNAELFNLGGFDDIHKGLVYYNTTLVKYDDGEWDIEANYQLPPFSDPITQKPPANGSPNRPENPTGNADIGWGLGAIYNSAYHGGYLFVDIDGTGYLDYHDSLGLDVNGQTTFYVFAEDLSYIGGLVGQNYYSNSADEADLSGNPPLNRKDPSEIDKRFRPKYSHDGVFFLDWEAFPNREVKIAPPNLKV
ncbi:MAG: hypothetical protein KAH01_04075, partial [Caldisericia bacterium]|nr:hypothetical protein [Caldisericia bacterium]